MFSHFIKKWAKSFPLKIKLLIGGVIVLGLIILGLESIPNSDNVNFLIPNLNSETISRIELIRQSQTVTLTKNKNNNWILIKDKNEAVPADSDKIKKLLKDISEIKKDMTVSDNSKKQNLFMVNETGMEIKLYAQKKIITDFFAGKPGSNWNSQYFRITDSDEIIQYNQNLLLSFEQDFSAPENKEEKGEQE